jgi:3-phosphoshikimate 1-carboxyvinyltransferase
VPAGTVRLPGSKSISNRLLLLAGLSEGTTDLHDLLDSDDTRVMLDALQAWAALEPDGSDHPHRHRLGGRLVAQRDLFLGNAGTAMRPLTAALAVLACQQGGASRCAACRACTSGRSATWSMRCASLGCRGRGPGQPGYPPLRLRGGRARPGGGPVRGDVSSQFLTALLLALPLAGVETVTW